MGEKTNILVFVFLFIFFIQSVYSEWIPKLDEAITTQQWNSLLKNFDIAKSYKTCSKIEIDRRSKFITIYKNRPATYVITGNGDGHVDIKFKDSNYIFDQEIKINNKQYMIIPPYQPVEWMWLRFGGDINICAFEDSQTTTNTEKVSGCACTEAIEAAETFYSAKFPHTIRKPDQQFFLTADITPETDDVTICTIVNADRLLRVSQMSEFWGGPISVAVFIQDLSEVSIVMDWYLSNNSFRRHVDIHLVYDDKIVAFNLPDRAFPVNILRNVAIRYARTANVFYIEGDFIPSPDLHSSLGPVRKRLASGEKIVFVIAPFSTDKYDFDMTQFPKDKQSLEKMVNGLNSPIKDLSYYNSHAAFDFKKWFKSTESYPQSFLGGYEPYYIGAKDYPLFEEIFIGCGADKVSHPTELNTAGYTFSVHPTGFIVHVDSTGMGSAWCRNWAGHERTTMKWEAFQLKTSNIYRSNAKGSFDSRVPWWDLAPVAVTKAKLGAGKTEEKESEVCEAPPRVEEKVCPPCNSPAEGPDSTNWEDMYNTATQDLSTTRLKTKKLEDDVSKRQLQLQNLENSVKTLRLENEKLQENSKFVLNLCIGIIVVMIVVVSVGVCVLPRGKRVWVLPTWKATHHNL